MTYTYRNPVYNHHGTVDVEIDHPTEGWIPFTASPDDPEPKGAELFAQIIAASRVTPIAPYVPEPPRVPTVVSKRQFYEALATMQVITEQEALDALKIGVIPTALQQLIDGLPAEQRFRANVLLAGATEFQRGHPLTGGFGEAYGWTPEQIDDFWRLAGSL